LEIADILVVNKADREGSDRAVRDLMQMLTLRAGELKEVEILKTIAARGIRDGSGMDELIGAIDRHRARTFGGETGRRRAEQRLRAHVTELVKGMLTDRAEAALRAHGGLEQVTAAILGGQGDPYTAAEDILAKL
jgi:LAO/AO transport system kinase